MLIIASVGVTTVPEIDVRKIILTGADVLRHNFSYYSIERNLEYINHLQTIIDDLNAQVKHLIDLPLNKTRLGDFDMKTFAVRENEEFLFRSATYSNSCHEYIPVQTSKLAEKVRLNQTITIGDGEIAVQVTDVIDQDTVKAKILNNGIIKYMKSFNINELPHNQEGIVKIYENIIEQTKQINPHYIAVSYIDAGMNEKIKEIKAIQRNNRRAQIIIKIENREGVNNIEKICQDPFYDIVMMDRGELGVNIPFEKIGLCQRKIISVANKLRKPLIISTQILESAIHNFVPARAEILDLTNMILNGVYGIMLCYETGAGIRPAYTVSVAKKIINEMEKYKRII